MQLLHNDGLIRPLIDQYNAKPLRYALSLIVGDGIKAGDP